MSVHLLSVVSALLALLLTAASPIAAQAEDVMKVHFIDVGQGLSTLVELPCAAVLIDAGGERSPSWPLPAKYDSNDHLLPYLREFFARRTDLGGRLTLLALTHPHPDHTRGVAKVIKEFQPSYVVTNGQRIGSGQTALLDYDRTRQGVRGFYVLQDHIGASGLTNSVIDPVDCAPTDPVIRALWGQVRDKSGWWWKDFGDENNHSLVIRVDFGKASVLFTGDLEETDKTGYQAGIERLLQAYGGTGLLDVDVYQVGHHGSHNGTSPLFLQAMSPKMAVISAGPPCKRRGYTAWNHGHPREVTVQELEAAVSLDRPSVHVTTFTGQETPKTRSMAKAVYSTSWDGTVVLEARPDGWWAVDDTTGAQDCTD